MFPEGSPVTARALSSPLVPNWCVHPFVGKPLLITAVRSGWIGMVGVGEGEGAGHPETGSVSVNELLFSLLSGITLFGSTEAVPPLRGF